MLVPKIEQTRGRKKESKNKIEGIPRSSRELGWVALKNQSQGQGWEGGQPQPWGRPCPGPGGMCNGAGPRIQNPRPEGMEDGTGPRTQTRGKREGAGDDNQYTHTPALKRGGGYKSNP